MKMQVVLTSAFMVSMLVLVSWVAGKLLGVNTFDVYALLLGYCVFEFAVATAIVRKQIAVRVPVNQTRDDDRWDR